MQKDARAIFVGGLAGSGKSFWILNSLNYWQEQKVNCLACKPFEIGTQAKRANNKDTDGELFAGCSQSKLHSTAYNIYSCNGSFPFGFSSACEGFSVKLAALNKNYDELVNNSSLLLVELLEGVLHPLNSGMTVLDWVKDKTTSILWLMSLDSASFLWNKSELSILAQAGFKIKIILNNYQKNLDHSWLRYVWLEMDKQQNCAVLGMLPPKLDNKTITEIWQKI